MQSTSTPTEKISISTAEYRGIKIVERNGVLLFVLDGQQKEAESLSEATSMINEYFRSKAH